MDSLTSLAGFGVAALLLFTPDGARADCGGHAKPALAKEFRASALVIRGNVVSALDMPLTGKNPEQKKPGALYQFRVDRVFKGKAPKYISYFTERDGSGFDVGALREYLMFLNPGTGWVAKAAPGAYYVNDRCGESRLWDTVNDTDRAALDKLAR